MASPSSTRVSKRARWQPGRSRRNADQLAHGCALRSSGSRMQSSRPRHKTLFRIAATSFIRSTSHGFDRQTSIGGASDGEGPYWIRALSRSSIGSRSRDPLLSPLPTRSPTPIAARSACPATPPAHRYSDFDGCRQLAICLPREPPCSRGSPVSTSQDESPSSSTRTSRNPTACAS